MPNGDHKEILNDKTGTCPVGSNILYMNFFKEKSYLYTPLLY